jgi:septum formation protein
MLTLASTSLARRRLLEAANLLSDWFDPGVEEAQVRARTGPALARARAEAKARAGRRLRPDGWLLAADQVAYDPDNQEQTWGKPRTPQEHLAQLERWTVRPHALVSAVALWAPSAPEPLLDEEVTLLFGRADLERSELEAYVRDGEGSSCAGGYALEGKGGFLFQRVEGDWSNVLGLPMPAVYRLLRRAGWRFGR